MSFSSVLKKVTPWIATAASLAPVPGAPLIAMAAKALSGGLGTEVKSTPDAIETAITTAMANPDQLATLKKIDDDFALQMKTLGFQEIEELAKIDADDRASARDLQKTTRSWVVPTMAISFVGGFFVIIVLKLFHVIGATDQTVNDLITTLRDGLMLVLSYYFGSSAGSAAKTAIMAANGNGNSKN